MSSQLVRTSFALERSGEFIHLVPAGPVIIARDQRMFQINDAPRVIAKSSTPLLIDREHLSERFDGTTEAAGWVEALEVRATGVWGRVEWTPKGKAEVEAKVYRYLSPVLELDAETREVLTIISIGLTNRPALAMSQIGDTSAYRERIRIACSERVASTPDVPPGVRASLHAKGFSDARIAEVVAFQQTDAYRGAGKKKQPAPTEAETRAACLARGNMSAEAYDSTRKFIDEQRARRRGE